MLFMTTISIASDMLSQEKQHFLLSKENLKLKVRGQNTYELEVEDNGAFDPEPC